MNLTLMAAARLSFPLPPINGLARVLLAGALLILLLNISAVQMGSALNLAVTVSGSYGNANGGGTQPSCFKTATTWNSVSGTYVSYGWPPTSGSCGSIKCPASLNLNTQSGFGFIPATVGTISDGVEFKLGSFTHYNHPVCASVTLSSVVLTLTLNTPGTTPNPTSYAYTMNLVETPNSGVCGSTCPFTPCTTPCSDRVYWSNLGSGTTFTGSDGRVYTLEIMGFKDCTNPGTALTEFITQENSDNLKCIYAKITECIVTITGNPSPLSLCPGGTGSLTVSATGPALTYQWYKQLGATPNPATDTKLTNTAPYSGVTGATLTITGVTTAQAGNYYVVVKGSCGASKTSASALLTVSSSPSVSTQPSSQTVCADDSATFNVVATGSGTLSYQWQQSIDSGTTWSPLAGKTAANLTLTGVTTSMNGYKYRVVVTSSICGSVTANAAILTVQAKPTVFAGSAQSICPGSTVQLAGSASNYDTITWSGGTGTFDNVHVLDAIYTPGQADLTAGTVTLTLTATPKSPCASPAISTVLITINTGNLTVAKVLSGQCESGTSFPVSISGPCGYTASHTFDCAGGPFTFTNLPTGAYTITETVPTGWTASGSTQTVTVSKAATTTATITNTRDTGSLIVTKVVSGQCESDTSFPVSISGPGGYTATHTFDCNGGPFTFTNLPTGAYTITETVPTGWTASGSTQTVTVFKGATATATITNTRDTGSLTVTKVVSGQCEFATSFLVSISGPGGYSSSRTFYCSGGVFTFTNLPTGIYTITETVPTGWTASGSPQTVTVSKGATATATIINTRDTGSLTVAKVINGQCESGTSFLVSISGPGDYFNSHTFGCSGGSYTFGNLPTGAYTIAENVPTGWTASGSPQTVTVSKGASATTTITNTRDTGSLTVTKVVSGQCESGTSFPVSINGPGGYSNSHAFDCSGGSFSFANLPTGTYTIKETVPVSWTASGSQQTVSVSKGLAETATITNSRCQTVDAGADTKVCSGDSVVIEGSATDATMVSWSVKSGSGILIWPYSGSQFKAAYTPPISGESEAILTFIAEGACADVSDDVPIYVVARPLATITVIEPPGWH